MRGTNFYEGWLSKCKAKYLCIYDNIRKCGIIIDFPQVSSLLEENAIKKTYWDIQDNCTNIIFLLPLYIVEKNNCIVHQWMD